MPGGVRGDFRKLENLIKNFKYAATPAFKIGLAREAAQACMKELMDEFRQERDPYGVAWAPLKHREGKILQKTGRGRGSFQTSATPEGFRIGTNVFYMGIHQRGAQYKGRAQKGKAMYFTRAGRRVKSGSARARYITVAKDHYRGGYGLPRRQQIPEKSTGGLGSWGPVIARTTRAYVKPRLVRGKAG